ncbi:hypothetical protein TIFTF001_007216 [Ficus carica]|uniref:F-box domain-containing protein n=1 Tax=Ficus carica TaxID=3494 RepID=A0AA87ZKS9_FICCA|nr:hypothetical protein TIFTF001_007216 [Ficus carica]
MPAAVGNDIRNQSSGWHGVMKELALSNQKMASPRIERFNQPTIALVELLLRLPADALTRFKCVNKSCCGDIDDSRLSLLSALRGNSKDMRHVIEDLDILLSKYIRCQRMTEWASIFHCDAMFYVNSRLFHDQLTLKALIGFEYDSKAENYKIVKIVFGLNGVIAEAMQESPTGECKILCFDICDEVFHVIPFSRPTSFKDSVACAMWNGKLCVFFESIERVHAENACQGYSCQVESTIFKSTFEMWVMDTIEVLEVSPSTISAPKGSRTLQSVVMRCF